MRYAFDGDWTEAAIGACIEVHRELGPGLLESAYQACLAQELTLRRVSFEQQTPVPLSYKGIEIPGYRMDFVIEKKLVLELKAVDKIAPIHEAQMLTYLRLTRLRIGLLVNFHAPTIRAGLRRLILSQ